MNASIDEARDRIQMREDQINYSKEFVAQLTNEFAEHNEIPTSEYAKYSVKRGLRNEDGTGVMAGLTLIGNVTGYVMQDGEKVPQPGKLIYRGIDVEELIEGFLAENRLGYEETAYLILFGALPIVEQLDIFKRIISEWRELPQNFTEDMILKAPSRDIMNKLGRCILALYSYDSDPENTSLETELFQAIRLIARTPTIVANAYAVKRHYYDGESLFLHHPQPELGLAENFLRMIRHDGGYTEDEAKLLDLCFVLHAEHGGGNNSAFACRVLSSSGTDIYSAVSAAVGSLKGPRHGGANAKVMAQFEEVKEAVKDWKDEDAITDYLNRVIRKEAGDGSGLIYGMGHAVYTLSDPRVKILNNFARTVAAQKGRMDELELLERIDRLGCAALIKSGKNKVISSNVDMYSGLIYSFLGIPPELYTPMFAIARMVGWCAHRIEEVYHSSNKIIRPAYKSLTKSSSYIPLVDRTDDTW